jgi:ketosteroid isomerase-like protein
MVAPMSNVTVVERCIEAISMRDVDTLDELSTDDVEVHPLRAMLEDTVYRGRPGLDQWMLDLEETWAELTIEVHTIEETGPDAVSALVTLHGRGHESDVPAAMRVELVARLRDGLVSHAATRTTG